MPPLPKRKISTRRQGKRRAAIKIGFPQLIHCPKCGKLKKPHQVCPYCGAYKVVKENEKPPRSKA